VDETSVEVVATSHALTDVEMLPDRRLVFTFVGINLPPEISDPEGSHGFVLYEVTLHPGLASGTKAVNTAAIVFDANPPIITNSVVTTEVSHAFSASGDPETEACNNVDDDCDGTVDGFATACGVGECVAAGSCVAGSDNCTPGAPVAEACNGLDDDCNGVADNGAPPPVSSTELVFSDPDTLSWTNAVPGLQHDVVQGKLDVLRSTLGDFTDAVTACAAEDTGATSLADPSSVPPAGKGWWFLVRPVGCGGAGSYGSSLRDTGISASPLACQ
jgi:hypothetical protein